MKQTLNLVSTEPESYDQIRVACRQKLDSGKKLVFGTLVIVDYTAADWHISAAQRSNAWVKFEVI